MWLILSQLQSRYDYENYQNCNTTTAIAVANHNLKLEMLVKLACWISKLLVNDSYFIIWAAWLARGTYFHYITKILVCKFSGFHPLWFLTNVTTKKEQEALPMTLWPCWELRSIAAKPKSPILTCPIWPLTKILSHLRSLCITGGSLLCKYSKPLRIWRAQFFTACISTRLYLCLYLYIHVAYYHQLGY